jgi:hypothetical protein
MPYPIIVTKLSQLIRTINNLTFKFLVLCISSFYSEKKWYKIAFGITYISRFKISQLLFKKKSIGELRAYDLNNLLALLTRTGRPFPIPYELTLDEVEHSSGLILCTVHIPLVKVAIRAFMEQPLGIDAAIVGMPTKDNRMAVWGLTERIPVLVKDSFVLLKIKNILSKNGTILLMTDSGGIYSPNIFHLCGKLGSKIVFFFAELKPNGTICTSFILPPFPNCETEIAITKNIEFLKQKSGEIMNRY